MIKHTAMKWIYVLCGMAATLVLVAGVASVPVLAVSNGIYLAAATPHYKHPVTGVIEDAGGDGSAVLGQSMTESATYKQALVEVDPQGNTYVTIRLQLMDNIKDPQFQVDGKAVTATLMQENYGSMSAENTADYRMKVNSENSVIRCNMFVIAMGREVIFYITVSNLQPGSGDFITSVKVEETKPSVVDTSVSDAPPVSTAPVTPKPSDTPSAAPVAPEPSDTPSAVPVTPDTSYVSSTDPVVPESSIAPAAAPVTSEPSDTSSVAPVTLDTSDTPSTDPIVSEPSDVSSDTMPNTTSKATSDKTSDSTPDSDSRKNDAAGIQEFDNNGNKVSNNSKSKEPEKSGSPIVWWLVGGVVVMAIAGGCVWYFVYYKKKK